MKDQRLVTFLSAFGDLVSIGIESENFRLVEKVGKYIGKWYGEIRVPRFGIPTCSPVHLPFISLFWLIIGMTFVGTIEKVIGRKVKGIMYSYFLILSCELGRESVDKYMGSYGLWI